MGGSTIPLRPLTLAELLDAALELLRRNALGLLTVSAVLAVTEQVLLYPVRAAAGAIPPYWDPLNDNLGKFWLLFGIGLGSEAAVIGLLGGLAARAAVPALVDRPAPRWLLGRGSRLGALLGLAAILTCGALLTAAAGFLPWIFWFMFSGLAAPALVIDQRRGPLDALGRSFVLVGRGRWRPGGIRLLGYLAWMSIRVALGFGTVAVITLLVHLPGRTWAIIITQLAFAIVNTVAYAALGCLDAVLHLENRMRVEGLDLALDRALRHGVPAERILAVRP